LQAYTVTHAEKQTARAACGNGVMTHQRKEVHKRETRACRRSWAGAVSVRTNGGWRRKQGNVAMSQIKALLW